MKQGLLPENFRYFQRRDSPQLQVYYKGRFALVEKQVTRRERKNPLDNFTPRVQMVILPPKEVCF